MEKEFIPYEQALDLKELGFDEPCFTKFQDYFNKTKLYPILTTLHLNTPYENEYNGYNQKIINDSSKRWVFTGYKNSVKDHNNDILSAPTFSQVFRWFREKYKSHSRVDIQDVELDWYSFEILEVRDGDYNNDLHTDMNFKSHEEAELECLKKLIEIVKNKQ
jgi:hypothetical protein